MKHTAPLRVVVLYTAGHLGSATILNKLIEQPHYDVVGIVRADTVVLSHKGISKINKQMKKLGWRFGWLLLWQRAVQNISYVFTRHFSSSKRLKATWELARDHGISVHNCGSINDASTLTFMADKKPDILISAYFAQILKADAIRIPRLGVLNVHPGWLPAYKGAMAYFWVLKNGHEEAGVTLHWIDEGIDTGSIIDRRKFTISQGMTQQNVLITTAILGAQMLEEVGLTLLKGEQPQALQINHSEEDAYYPMPGSDEFNSYFKSRRYFRIRDVFKSIRKGAE